MKTVSLFKLTIILCYSMVCAPSIADDSAIDPRAEFERGISLFSTDQYSEALAAFERSYSVTPKSSILFNMGMCQKVLFRYRDSINNLRKYLEQTPSDPHGQHEDAKSAIEEILQLVGHLRFSEITPGSRVQINEKDFGELPTKDSLILEPGRHKITVSADNHQPLVIFITAVAGAETTIRAILDEEPKPADQPGPVQDPQKQSAPALAIQSPSVDLSKQPQGNRLSALGWTGIATGVLGLTAVGAGIFFATEWTQLNDEAHGIQPSGTKPDKTRYEEIKQTLLPDSESRLIISFSIGAPLVAAGTTMLLWNLLKNRPSSTKEPQLQVSTMGRYTTFSVSF